MSENSVKPTTWFWVVAILSLLWNLAGVGAYLAQVNMSTDELNALPETQRALYELTPFWVTGSFAIAVFAGTLGSILLLFKRSLAITLFFVSLLGILVQNYHGFFISKAHEVIGPEATIMPAFVIAFAMLLIWFSRMSKRKGWLS